MGITPEIAFAAIGTFCAVIGVPSAIYAVFISKQAKRNGDIDQLVRDLTSHDVFCEKIVGFVVPSDRFRERAREVFTDRMQMMINERHIVGGGEDREFKDGLRREIQDMKAAMDALSKDVRLVLRRTDG